MSNAIYGKTISRSFIADDGSQYLRLPTQTPTIYLFPYGTIPSRAQAAAGTGAIQTISAWTQSGASEELTYSYAPVIDPDTAGNMASREYWEAVNYVLDIGGQVQTKLRMLIISRAEVIESIPGLSAEDIIGIWPSVVSYTTSAQLANFLPLAEAEMRQEIGLAKWSRLSKLVDAKICLAYKAIEMMAASQVVKGNADKFVWMVEYFGEKYTKAISKIDFPLDADGDGQPEEILQASQPVVIIAR